MHRKHQWTDYAPSKRRTRLILFQYSRSNKFVPAQGGHYGCVSRDTLGRYQRKARSGGAA